jgi:hypothetical protein
MDEYSIVTSWRGRLQTGEDSEWRIGVERQVIQGGSVVERTAGIRGSVSALLDGS